MAYQILTAGRRTEITDMDANIRVAVFEKDKQDLPAGTAYCLATQYRIQAGFVPERVMIFQTNAIVELELVKKRLISFF